MLLFTVQIVLFLLLAQDQLISCKHIQLKNKETVARYGRSLDLLINQQESTETTKSDTQLRLFPDDKQNIDLNELFDNFNSQKTEKIISEQKYINSSYTVRALTKGNISDGFTEVSSQFPISVVPKDYRTNGCRLNALSDKGVLVFPHFPHRICIRRCFLASTPVAQPYSMNHTQTGHIFFSKAHCPRGESLIKIGSKLVCKKVWNFYN